MISNDETARLAYELLIVSVFVSWPWLGLPLLGFFEIHIWKQYIL